MPTRCNRGFYCRSYCSLNMVRAPLCPSSGAQEYYTVVVACGISCCGFSSSWSGVELRVLCPVCRMVQQFYNIKDTLQFEIIRVPCRQQVHNICTKNCVIIKRQYFINALQYSLPFSGASSSSNSAHANGTNE